MLSYLFNNNNNNNNNYSTASEKTNSVIWILFKNVVFSSSSVGSSLSEIPSGDALELQHAFWAAATDAFNQLKFRQTPGDKLPFLWEPLLYLEEKFVENSIPRTFAAAQLKNNNHLL